MMEEQRYSCDKKCDSHADVREGLKEMDNFKEETIGKMSKCITALGILFIIFTSSMVVASGSFLKSTQTAEASVSLEKKVDSHIEYSEKQHAEFTRAITKVEVLDTKINYIIADMKEIKALLKGGR